MSLTIHGRAWIDGALKDSSVRIEDGKIAAISERAKGDAADSVVLGPREILFVGTGAGVVSVYDA